MQQINKTMYIVRGLPGSGKSTYSKSLGILHFEADMYFMRNGEYKFDATKLHWAHQWCLKNIQKHLENNYDIVVSNTFTTLKELRPYVTVAREAGRRIVLVEVKTTYGSVHGVPEETMEKMRTRWQDVPEDMYDELITIKE